MSGRNEAPDTSTSLRANFLMPIWIALNSTIQMDRYFVIAPALVALVALLLFGSYPYLKSRTVHGSIILSSPTVYTRQKLVNDRLSQASWLTKQLQLTEKEPLQFDSIDGYTVASDVAAVNGNGSITLTNPTNSQSIQEAPKESSGTDSSGSPNTNKELSSTVINQTYKINQTTLDRFLAMSNYRDTVRSQLMETLLDDRHDISGNTIYRLGFDTTILGGNDNSELAVIYVQLKHDPFITLPPECLSDTQGRNSPVVQPEVTDKSNQSTAAASAQPSQADSPQMQEKVSLCNSELSLITEEYQNVYKEWLDTIRLAVHDTLDNIVSSFIHYQFDKVRKEGQFDGFIDDGLCSLILADLRPLWAGKSAGVGAKDITLGCDNHELIDLTSKNTLPSNLMPPATEIAGNLDSLYEKIDQFVTSLAEDDYATALDLSATQISAILAHYEIHDNELVKSILADMRQACSLNKSSGYNFINKLLPPSPTAQASTSQSMAEDAAGGQQGSLAQGRMSPPSAAMAVNSASDTIISCPPLISSYVLAEKIRLYYLLGFERKRGYDNFSDAKSVLSTKRSIEDLVEMTLAKVNSSELGKQNVLFANNSEAAPPDVIKELGDVKNKGVIDDSVKKVLIDAKTERRANCVAGDYLRWFYTNKLSRHLSPNRLDFYLSIDNNWNDEFGMLC